MEQNVHLTKCEQYLDRPFLYELNTVNERLDWHEKLQYVTITMKMT